MGTPSDPIIYIGDEYIHFRNGKTYEVITIAECTDTHKDLVIYRCQLSSKVYARPREQWFELVDDPNSTIHRIPRFRPKNPRTPSLIADMGQYLKERYG